MYSNFLVKTKSFLIKLITSWFAAKLPEELAFFIKRRCCFLFQGMRVNYHEYSDLGSGSSDESLDRARLILLLKLCMIRL